MLQSVSVDFRNFFWQMQTQKRAENTQEIGSGKGMKEIFSTRLQSSYQSFESVMLKIIWVVEWQQYDWTHNQRMVYKSCDSREYDEISAAFFAWPVFFIHRRVHWCVHIKYGKVADRLVPNCAKTNGRVFNILISYVHYNQ